jgi:hypothetical protein
MAKVTNAFTTYEAKGNREDLSNFIYNIDPVDTPVVTMAGRRSVTNRTFDWQTEKLPAVDTTPREEGFVLAPAASTPTVREKNVCQINSRDATVSGTQENADAAGKKSEMAHQMALVSKALKRDVETAFCSTQAIDYGTAGTPIRKTRGLLHWLKTNIDKPSTLTLPATETTAYPTIAAGDVREFTEAMLGNLMQLAYDNGAEPTKLVCKPDLKRQVTSFQGRSSSQVLVGKTEVSNVVDVYASDFGRLSVIPSRFCFHQTVYLLDPEYLAMGNYRPFQQTPMAKTGDAEVRMILNEWGVECRNEAAHAAAVGVKAGATITPEMVADTASAKASKAEAAGK